MAAEVLYRKYRPQTFSEVAGQEPIMRTLRNAVASHKVSHAYLFSGPRGTGKTSSGRLLAKAANCRDAQEGEPCNKCDSCVAFSEGRALDLVELDAASNRGIDEIRSLREKVGFAPGSADFKVYIIDEAHMLTEPAFNALLKTLEEPPPHVIFVLATTEPHKIPATIGSRCQRFDFRRVPLEAAIDRLAHICDHEGITCPREALELIARSATGSMRDAINLLEQTVDYHGRELSVETVQSGLGLSGDARSADLARLVLRGNLGEGLALIAAVRDDGLDLRQFQREVVGHLRRLLLMSAGAETTLSLTKEQAQEMKKTLEGVGKEEIVRALRAFGQVDVRADPLSSLPLEMALAECVLAREAAEARRAAAPPPVERREPAPARPAFPSPAPRDERPVPAAPSRRRAVPASPAVVEPGDGPDESEADVGPPAVPVPAEVSALREKWPAIYQLARKINFKTGALLNSGCAIIGVDDNTVVFGFRHGPLAEKMNAGEGGAYLQALREAVQKVLGAVYEVKCVYDPQAATGRGGGGSGGHLVQAARELGARVIGSDDGGEIP
ncbi:MAG: DNA polymerase III subunit gamma/tau [Dehalococcoidia bacterium]|jgi:DNA polymerase-3 subunit gamma/tau